MSVDEWVGYGIPEDVLDTASKWIAVLDSERVEESVQNEFLLWLQQDDMHQVAFMELSELWARTSIIKQCHHLIEENQVIQFPVSDSCEPNIAISNQNLLYYSAITIICVGFIAAMF